jgi:hypothetical protein
MGAGRKSAPLRLNVALLAPILSRRPAEWFLRLNRRRDEARRRLNMN